MIAMPPYLAALLCTMLTIGLLPFKATRAQDTPGITTFREIRHFPKTSSVVDLDFAPDGLRFVSGGNVVDRSLRIYDVESGEEVDRLEAGRGATVCVDYAPDGRHIAFGGITGTAQVWDSQAGEVVSSFEHKPMVFKINYAPDGQSVATCGMDSTVRLWNPHNGEPLFALEGHKKAVLKAAFSPCGRWILTGSGDKTARLWDAASGELLHSFPHPEWVWGVAFSPDGRWLATSTGGYIKFPYVTELYTAGDDSKIRVWDAKTRSLVKEIDAHEHIISEMVFSPDGSLLVTGSFDLTLCVWDVQLGRCVGQANVEMEVQCLDVSPSGNYVLCGGRPRGTKFLRLYEMRGTPIWLAEMSLAQIGHDGSSARQLASAPGFTDHASPAYSPSGQTIAWHATPAGTNDSTVFLARADGRRIRRVTSGKSPRWLDDKTLLVLRDDQQLYTVDTTGRDEKPLTQGPCASLSHDGQRMVLVRGQQLQLANLGDATGQPLKLDPPPHIASGMALAHDGRRIAYVAQSPGGGNGLYVADLSSGAGQKLADSSAGAEFFPDWSPDDSKILFTAGPNYIGPDQPANRVYCVEVASGKVEALTDESHDCRHAVWSPDGRQILVTRTNTRQLLPAEGG